ncbi:MAG: hypothetical protein WDZ41_02265 [Candidatus Babeliales bacterium]
MKKLLVSLLLIFMITFLHADPPIGFPLFKTAPIDRRVEKTAQSFLFYRPIFQNIAAQLSSYWHDAVYEKIGCLMHSFQIMPMYQQSFSNAPVARYFLINQKNTLVFKGDMAPAPNLRDVRAEWLQLPNDFVGTFSLNPKQKQFGIWFELNQDLKKFSIRDLFASLWVGAAFAFQIVENTLQPSQLLISGPSQNSPKDIIAAFNRTNMRFGKIANRKRENKSVSELQFKLGATLMARDGFQIGGYSSVIFPTAKHQDPTYMFDPFLGHNRHFGFGSGVHFQLPLNRDVDCKLVALFFNVENLFFLRNFQRRSLNLRFKPWSRYLLLNKRDGTMNIPAINVLSPCVKVQPFNFVDLSAGLRIQVKWCEFEIGYSFWAHGDELLELPHPFPEDYGIAGDGALVPGTNIGATASESTIANRAPNDLNSSNQPTFVPIRERDLDLRSGAARAGLAHRIHCALGIVHDQCTFALFWGLGGFVEIPQNNTILQNWGLWGKIGGTF